MNSAPERTLIIVADDLGLDPDYDQGILEAAAAGAIDGTGAMVLQGPRREDVAELAELGVAVGLHLEPAESSGKLGRDAVLRQLELFERLAARPPDFLDGHHHCHATAEVTEQIAEVAAALGLPVRSVDTAHRESLRAAGVRTPDLLVGRYEEADPAIPDELLFPPAGVRTIEWMVHPGHPSGSSRSSYDRGRGEDLRTLLSFEPPPGTVRGDHRGLPT